MNVVYLRIKTVSLYDDRFFHIQKRVFTNILKYKGKAKKEHRKAELLPKVSAHVMRHTSCTRMAECRMDIKVLHSTSGDTLILM